MKRKFVLTIAIFLFGAVVASLAAPKVKAVDQPYEGYGWARITQAVGLGNQFIYRFFDATTGLAIAPDTASISLTETVPPALGPQAQITYSCGPGQPINPCPSVISFNPPNNTPGYKWENRNYFTKAGYHSSLNAGLSTHIFSAGNTVVTSKNYLTTNSVGYQVSSTWPISGDWYSYDPDYTVLAYPSGATPGATPAGTSAGIYYQFTNNANQVINTFTTLPAAGPFPLSINIPPRGFATDGTYGWGGSVSDDQSTNSGWNNSINRFGIDRIGPTSACGVNNPLTVAPGVPISITVNSTDTSGDPNGNVATVLDGNFRLSPNGGGIWISWPPTSNTPYSYSGSHSEAATSTYTGPAPSSTGTYIFQFHARDKSKNSFGAQSQYGAYSVCTGTLTVVNQDFSANAIMTPLSIKQGEQSTGYLQVHPISGYNGTVSITATVTPKAPLTPPAIGTSITFSPTSLTFSGGAPTDQSANVNFITSYPTTSIGDYDITFTVSSSSPSITHNSNTITISVGGYVPRGWFQTTGGDVGSERGITGNASTQTNRVTVSGAGDGQEYVTYTCGTTLPGCAGGMNASQGIAPGTTIQSKIGNENTTGTFGTDRLYRAYLAFNTSLSGVPISQAWLRVYVKDLTKVDLNGDATPDDFYVDVKQKSWGPASGPVSGSLTAPGVWDTPGSGTCSGNFNTGTAFPGTAGMFFSQPLQYVEFGIDPSCVNASGWTYLELSTRHQLQISPYTYFGKYFNVNVNLGGNTNFPPQLRVAYNPLYPSNADYLAVANGAISNFISAKNWLLPNYALDSDASATSGGANYYNYFWNTIGVNRAADWTPSGGCTITGSLPATGCQLSTTADLPDSGSGVTNFRYKKPSGSPTLTDVTYNITSASSGNPTVVFIDGNFYVNKDILVSGNKKWIFVVNGNVWVNPTVAEIDAVIITSGKFESSHWLNSRNDTRFQRLQKLQEKIEQYKTATGHYPVAAAEDTSNSCSTVSGGTTWWTNAPAGTGSWGSAAPSSPCNATQGLRYQLSTAGIPGYGAIDINNTGLPSPLDTLKDPSNGASIAGKVVATPKRFALRYKSWDPGGGPIAYALFGAIEDDDGLDASSAVPDPQFFLCGGDYNNPSDTLYKSDAGTNTACRYYPLLVKGSVFAQAGLTLGRDLGDDNNSIYAAHPAIPGEKFVYDPSLLYFFSKIISNGQALFSTDSHTRVNETNP
ncbi:MAG TPA: hypothetical protein VLE47_04715 [Candidatus Saccharimonadales bacterium]|nr:hypothetical protein [Candidatus Saccharimonadales bacterium]